MGRKEIVGYEVKLIKLDTKGEETNTVVTKEVKNDVNEVIFNNGSGANEMTTKLDPDTLYKVSITVLDDDKLATTHSDAKKSDGFFIISQATFTQSSPTSNSINIEVSAPVNVYGKTTTYKVEVWKVNKSSEAGKTEGLYSPFVKELTLPLEEYQVGKYRLVVPNLEPGVEYAFKVKVDVDGVEGVSDYIHNHTGGYNGHGLNCTTKKETPELANLKVVTGPTTGNNEIAIIKDSSDDSLRILSINGKRYEYLSRDYESGLDKIYDLIESNQLREDDVFTYTAEKLTVKLENRATDSGDNRTFNSSKLGSNTVLELEGDGFERAISTDTGVKEVILKGNEALFNIAGVNAKKVTLENGVNVATGANREVVVKPGTVTINGVDVTVTSNTTISANSTTFTVTANEGTNNLTFNNPTGGVTVYLKGKSGYGSTQEGLIKIIAKGAVNVSGAVSGSEMNVKSDLDITVTDGTVNIEGVELEGSKKVTVTKNKTQSSDPTVTVTARAKTTIDFNLSEIAFKAYSLSKAEDVSVLTTKGIITASDTQKQKEEKVTKLNNYLNSFGLNGTGATISVNANSEKVTITFPDAVSNTQISNLK